MMCEQKNKIICTLPFIGPHKVISSRLDSCQLINDFFQARPEADDLNGVITPACCDAEIGLVWCHMVDPVVLTRQDYATILQPNHPSWQARVGVRPLVDLIGECDE